MSHEDTRMPGQHGLTQPGADGGPAVPSRRRFLRSGLNVTGGAMAAGALGSVIAPGAARAGAVDPANLPPNDPPWTTSAGYGVVEYPYGLPSAYEAHVVRRNVDWLTADRIASISFTPLADLTGIITPNGVCFERHHGGCADINPDEHRLIIHGMVERPLIFTMDDLTRFPSVSRIHFLECPANGGMEWKGAQMTKLQFTHGMIHCCEWTGVPLSVLLDEAGVKPGAKWVLAEGADAAGNHRSIPLEKCLDDALVAWGQNGERLRREQGYPIRLFLPGYEGNMSIKWLRRLEVGDKPWHTREETSRYTDLMPDGKSRQFTFVQETNSVITFPCPEKPLRQGPGLYHISGLAWSGKGKIARVDVSTDGGNNWKPARLNEPVLSKCLTRFEIPWRWDGSPAFLQARAIDESGYVQPSLNQIREVRGVNNIYHKNCIYTWQVLPNGEVENVQIL
jgi:sulfane dehydrogenase subunit SoxC